MATQEIERLRYYQGQYLGELDFEAQQNYHRDALRRHSLGQHTWGIVTGLRLVETRKEGGQPGVNVYLMPGMALDGFGREIVLLEPYQLPESLFGSYVKDVILPVWLRYREQNTQPPLSGYALCNVQDQSSRILETFEVVVGELTTTQLQRDQITVAGKLVNAEDEEPDASVPYQDLPETNVGARWLIRLGKVHWSGSAGTGGYFIATAEDVRQDGRVYVGAVAESVLAPAADLRLRPRVAPVPPADADSADFASVEGRLRVDGRLVAMRDVFVRGGKLSFQTSDPQPPDPPLPPDPARTPDPPLWIQRLTDAARVNSDLRVHIGDDPKAATNRLTVGPLDTDGKTEKVTLAVRADDRIIIPTGTLSFGRQTRQMIDLWASADANHEYGIGVQAATLYFRSDHQFCWFRGGSHNDGPGDPGGGTRLMRLEESGNLDFGNRTRQMLGLWSSDDNTHQYGIGVQAATLYFRSDFDFCWFRGGLHADGQGDPGGGTLAMRLNSSNQLYVPGTLGVGTPAPAAKLHLLSFEPQARVETTGDRALIQFAKGGNLQWDFGVGTGPGNNDFWFGDFSAYRLILQKGSGNVGIGTLAPQRKLHVTGDRIRMESTDGLRNVELRADGSDLDIESHGGKLYVNGVGSQQDTVINPFGGNVGVGTTAPAFKVDVNGDVRISGNLGTHGFSPAAARPGWGGGIHTWDVEAEGTIRSTHGYVTGPADVAENYYSDKNLEPGDVVRLDRKSDRIVPSDRPNDTLLLGVVSSAPGMLLGGYREEAAGKAAPYPVALCGCVPCKVTDENGPIARGDLLTTSSTPGHAMRAAPIPVGGEEVYRPGTILGKAMGSLKKGKGIIEVFVAMA
jgi:hypothetical protein